MASQTLSLRDGRFQVHYWTRGRGAPVLYLHGWMGMHEWPAWLDPLADRFRIVAPQHPGYGLTTGLEHLDDVIDFALYYLDLADALGLERPALLGHSLGANVALEMAALSPCSVGKLALVAPTGLWDEANPVADIFAMTDRDRDQMMWHNHDQAQAKGLVQVPETDDEKRRSALDRTRALAAAAKFLFPIPDRGLKKRIHRVKAPTLLLWGAADRVVPPGYGKLFQQHIPSSQVVVVPEAAHMPHLEQPGKVLEAVGRFLG